MAMNFRGLVWKRDLKNYVFQENPAAYPRQKFPGVPPSFVARRVFIFGVDSGVGNNET